MSSRRDNFEYSMKSISWELPADAKNSQGYAPQKLEVESASLLEEKFTILSDYLFNDEGDKAPFAFCVVTSRVLLIVAPWEVPVA